MKVAMKFHIKHQNTWKSATKLRSYQSRVLTQSCSVPVSKKAVHALFSLRRHIDFSSLKPSLACKIFDSMISPILTYNSKVWGLFIKSDFKYWGTSPGNQYLCILWSLPRKAITKKYWTMCPDKWCNINYKSVDR